MTIFIFIFFYHYLWGWTLFYSSVFFFDELSVSIPCLFFLLGCSSFSYWFLWSHNIRILILLVNILQAHFPNLSLAFNHSYGVLGQRGVLNFHAVKIIYLFLYGVYIWCYSLKAFSKPQIMFLSSSLWFCCFALNSLFI